MPVAVEGPAELLGLKVVVKLTISPVDQPSENSKHVMSENYASNFVLYNAWHRLADLSSNKPNGLVFWFIFKLVG
jgi:hypothetical protein